MAVVVETEFLKSNQEVYPGWKNKQSREREELQLNSRFLAWATG